MKQLSAEQLNLVSGGLYAPPFTAPKGVSDVCWVIVNYAIDLGFEGKISDEAFGAILMNVCTFDEGMKVSEFYANMLK